MFGLGQTKKKKEAENKVRQTKAEEWKYKGRIDQDGAYLERKEKAQHDQNWKETQRDTKAHLKDGRDSGRGWPTSETPKRTIQPRPAMERNGPRSNQTKH